MYILNLTNTVLSLGKYVEVKAGKYLQIDKWIHESEEVAYAVRAKWATLHDSPPKEIEFDTDKINFSGEDAYEGSTEFPKAEAAPESVASVEPVVVSEAVAEVPVDPVAEPVADAEPVVEDTSVKAKRQKVSQAPADDSAAQ